MSYHGSVIELKKKENIRPTRSEALSFKNAKLYHHNINLLQRNLDKPNCNLQFSSRWGVTWCTLVQLRTSTEAPMVERFTGGWLRIQQAQLALKTAAGGQVASGQGIIWGLRLTRRNWFCGVKHMWDDEIGFWHKSSYTKSWKSGNPTNAWIVCKFGSEQRKTFRDFGIEMARIEMQQLVVNYRSKKRLTGVWKRYFFEGESVLLRVWSFL